MAPTVSGIEDSGTGKEDIMPTLNNPVSLITLQHADGIASPSIGIDSSKKTLKTSKSPVAMIHRTQEEKLMHSLNSPTFLDVDYSEQPMGASISPGTVHQNL